MKIIIGAMKEELEAIITDLKAEKVPSLINEYQTSDKQIVIAWTGIGLVNASTGLSYLLTKYQDQNIEIVINIGTAGTLNSAAKIGDIVLVDKAVYTTANATGFGYDYGQIPAMPKYYQANENALKVLKEKLVDEQPKVVNVSSSDLFISSVAMARQYLTNFTLPIDILEMECASYFQTAFIFNVPIVGIKVISDLIGSADTSEVQFDQFIIQAAQKISSIIKKII